MFPYQRMITYVTGLFYNRISHRQKHISYISQDSLSITVDRYLLWIALEFPLIKIHEKGAKCDKICFFYWITITETYTGFSYMSLYIPSHIWKWIHIPLHMFLSYSIIQSRITKSLCNDHKSTSTDFPSIKDIILPEMFSSIG